MTREETRKAIEVMKAYVDGKVIEFNDDGTWSDVEPEWSWGGNPKTYRIKPESKLRPYKDIKEFMNALKEHGEWLVDKFQNYATMPVFVGYTFIEIIGGGSSTDNYGHERLSFIELLKSYTWLDGAPCGVVEE